MGPLNPNTHDSAKPGQQAPTKFISMKLVLDRAPTFNGLRMAFDGKLAVLPVEILVDGGAFHNFLDVDFAKAHKLSLQAHAGHTKCAGGNSGRVQGVAKLQVQLNHDQYNKRTDMYAISLPRTNMLILGQPWLLANSATLDCSKGTLRYKRKRKTTSIIPPMLRHPQKLHAIEHLSPEDEIISALQYKKCVNQIGIAMLCMIQTTSEAFNLRNSSHIGGFTNVLTNQNKELHSVLEEF